jgi:uncharacterized protein
MRFSLSYAYATNSKCLRRIRTSGRSARSRRSRFGLSKFQLFSHVAVPTDLDTLLTEEELDFIDSFLLDRIDDDLETLGMDEGVLCVSELDGFLTAIVSGPETLMPSRWLPAFWGDFPPAFDEPQDAERIMALFVRHMNGIARHLMEAPETFEPMFLSREWDGKTVLVVDEWCEGFMRGVALSRDAWGAGGSIVRNHLAFCEAGGWTGHNPDDHADIEQRQLAIAPSVRAIHAYWLARRQLDAPSEDARKPRE